MPGPKPGAPGRVLADPRPVAVNRGRAISAPEGFVSTISNAYSEDGFPVIARGYAASYDSIYLQTIFRHPPEASTSARSIQTSLRSAS